MLDGKSGVYSLALQAGERHFGWSKNLGKRLVRLARLLQSNSIVSRIPAAIESLDCWPTSSQLEQLLVLYSLTRQAFPVDYVKRLRLRRPWFVGLLDREKWARLAVTQRLGSSAVLQLGPFGSRDAAAQFEETASALFHLRRCVEPIDPNPSNPGCIYGEIGQCSRPCQAAVNQAEYDSGLLPLNNILLNGPDAYLRDLSVRRKQASEDLDFEAAAAFHKRLEKAQRMQDLHSDGLRPVWSFHGLALTPSQDSDQIRIWPMKASRWRDAIDVHRANKPAVAAAFERITNIFANADEDQNSFVSEEQSDHLALYRRWHRSSFHQEIWLPVPASAMLRKASFTRAVQRVAFEAS